MRFKCAVLGILAVVLGGCVAPQAGVQTASGRAEVSTSVPAAALKGQITNEMLDHGFTIVSDSPSLVIFDHVSTDFAANALFGTAASGPPHYRVAFSFVEMPGNTRCVSDIQLVSNAGTAFERRNDFNQGNDAQTIQQVLNRAVARSFPAAVAAAP